MALLPLAVFVLLLALFARGLASGSSHALPSALLDKPAPAFALERLDDASRMLRREDLLGRPWVLNVWASWCAACVQEHPALLELARTQDVRLIGLNYKDRRPEALDWLARRGNPYEASLFDAGGHVGLDFGVYGVPETFVIDREGRVRFKHVGALTPELIRTRIEPLLKELDG